MLVSNGSHEHLGIERLDCVNVGLERCHALIIQAHAVHTLGIEVTHLLLDASTGIVGSQRGDDVLYLIAAVLGQLVKGAEARILRVERIVEFPTATGILIKVLARLGTRVQVIAVYPLDGVACNRCQCNE